MMARIDDERDVPRPDKTSFVCPHCETFAQQGRAHPFSLVINIGPGNVQVGASERGWQVTDCQSCRELTFWKDTQMVWPAGLLGPAAPSDLPAVVLPIYEEARAVGYASPRSAAALLRLALEELVDDLEPGDAALNTKVGALVRRGLAPRVQQAMDSLRVYGNNGAHIGEIDLSDDRTTVLALFKVLHLVVESVITNEREVNALYSGLPAGALAAIQRRDGSSTTP